MTNEEKLKMVAEYDGYVYDPEYFSQLLNRKGIWDNKENGDMVFGFDDFMYHKSYDWQIPVWQKLCKQHLYMNDKCTDDIKQFMLFKEQYFKAICYGTPLESFEILVQAINFINQLKKKTMKTVITNFSNPTSEGVTLHLNQPEKLKTGVGSFKEFYVSWDKIGNALFENYATGLEVDEMRKLRGE